MENQIVYVKLTKKECSCLKKKLSGHGSLAQAARLTGLNVNTIKRAKDGLTILPENATLIRHIIIN